MIRRLLWRDCWKENLKLSASCPCCVIILKMDKSNLMVKLSLMDKIVALCKRRGFIYPGSEIYGGLNGTWDLGSLGTELSRNIKNEWWKEMVLQRDDVVGLDSSIIHYPKVWEASGH